MSRFKKIESLKFSELYESVLKNYIRPQYLTPAQANLLTLELLDILSDKKCSNSILLFLHRLLTKDTYINLIDERNLIGLCGYPNCDKSPERVPRKNENPLKNLSQNVHKHNHTSPILQEFKSTKELIPSSYLNNYCGKEHYQCSRFFHEQLNDNALFLRENIWINKINGDFLDNNNCGLFFDKFILLENVWKEQSKNNQSSLIEILNNLELKTEVENDNTIENKENNLIPEGLISNTIVEKTPDTSMILDEDEDEEVSMIERAKMIEGYVTEF